MFERPLLLWLLTLAPVVAMPGIAAIGRGRWVTGGLGASLRLAGFAIIVLLVAGLRLPGRTAARRMAVVVAVDRSRSIAPDQFTWMRQYLSELGGSMNARDRLAVLVFGRDVRLVAPPADPRAAASSAAKALRSDIGVDRDGTDIAMAMTGAAALFPPDVEKRLVILSDGNETESGAMDELPALVEDGVRIFTMAPPPSQTHRVALTGFVAPAIVRAGTSFVFRLAIESEAPHPIQAHLRLAADGNALGGQLITLKPGMNRFDVPYRMSRAGAYLMSAEIDLPSGVEVLNRKAETALSVVDAPRVLVISSDGPSSFGDALRLRNYRVEQASPRGLPAHPQDYLGYQAIIVDDASAQAMGRSAQQALNRYVADFGGGLIVTGGALRDDGFRGGALERALPIEFQPQPPPPAREPIAVYLCIDRSNSMSYNSRYPAVRDGERIRYAKQAAIALLRQLDDTDYAGVIAFDSQPYFLSHLRPLGEDRSELEERIERLEPGGGTDFKEALEIAEKEILESRIAVRQVILITDGDTNRQYHDHDALIADYAEKHIPVSTIRIGPDLANLRLLQDFAQATGGTFYRVEDIERLPQLLVRLTRKAMNLQKRGQTRLEYEGSTTILKGIKPAQIPPLEFVATTAPKDAAMVPLKIRRANKTLPLLAAWAYGLGRSVVFAADPDSLASLSWIRWDRYAEFWSQVVNWVARPGGPGPFNLKVSDQGRGGINVIAEKADAAPVNNLFCRITGPRRAVDIALTQVSNTVYRGEAGPFSRGKYVATLMRKAGDIEQPLVTRQFGVVGADAPDAAELRIRGPNVQLLRNLAAESGGGFQRPVSAILKRRGATVVVYRSVQPWLIPLLIALVLGEVLVRRKLLID
jgi:Ca-activated chloride channel homolog